LPGRIIVQDEKDRGERDNPLDLIWKRDVPSNATVFLMSAVTQLKGGRWSFKCPDPKMPADHAGRISGMVPLLSLGIERWSLK